MNRKNALLCRILTIVLGLTTLFNTRASITNTKDNEGLLIAQLSWPAYAFDTNVKATLTYKKNLLADPVIISGTKNQFLVSGIKEGTYNLLSVSLSEGSIPSGKKLTISLDKKMTIEAGKITNLGLLFISPETDSKKVTLLPVDNTPDIKRLLSLHFPKMNQQPESFKQVFPFIEKEKIDGIIANYAKILVDAENAHPNPQVSYMYATLGILLKMTRDENGKVIDYKQIPTKTYQEVTGVTFNSDKLFCRLGNGEYLYGAEDNLSYVQRPAGVFRTIYFLGNSLFLTTDMNFNLYVTNDTFNWKVYTGFNQGYGTNPTVYLGPRNIYVYSTSALLTTAYSALSFKEVPLPQDEDFHIGIDFKVVETKDKLFIGPNNLGLKKARLYITDSEYSQWETLEMPKSMCSDFTVDKNDDNHLYAKCTWKDILFESFDGGNSWKEQ